MNDNEKIIKGDRKQEKSAGMTFSCIRRQKKVKE